MSIPQAAGGPIQSRDDLVRYIADAGKPRAQWRIGTEHEKFVYDLKTHKPLSYAGHPGIREMLEGMQRIVMDEDADRTLCRQQVGQPIDHRSQRV